jgi:hypothetical protein
MEAVLRLAAEAAQRRQDGAHMQQKSTANGHLSHPSEEQRRTINYHA